MIKDFDIRKKFILDNKEFFKSGIFINEYSVINKNIADLCFYKDKFYCYEIKSEADNLKRLVNQLKSYFRIFDYVYVICHKNHINELSSMVSKYNLKKLGIIEVDNNLNFKEVKPALETDRNFRIGYLLRNISKDILIDICSKKKIKLDKWNKEHIVNKLCGKIELSEIEEYLYNTISSKYIVRCHRCGSNLIYNSSDNRYFNRKVKKFHDKNSFKINEYVKIQKLKFIKCFECECEFNVKLIKEENKLIKTYYERMDK